MTAHPDWDKSLDDIATLVGNGTLNIREGQLLFERIHGFNPATGKPTPRCIPFIPFTPWGHDWEDKGDAADYTHPGVCSNTTRYQCRKCTKIKDVAGW